MEKIDSYIHFLMEHSTASRPMWNQELLRSGRDNKWNYIDGCMMTAFLQLYRITGDKKYLDFTDAFVGWFVEEDGSIRTYDPKEKNIDNINPGRNLFALYDLTGKEKYRRAADRIRSQLDLMPRTKAGNFWHKEIYPWQVWLDGLYMAQPFYMEYETRYNGMRYAGDSVQQFLNVEKCMRDPETGLYYHGYDESRSMYWADPVTGCSANFWCRALGWFALSLVDTLSVMDMALYYEYRSLIRILRDLAEALIRWQAEDGMFWQVVNYPGEEGNYKETSGTALIAYAFLKGSRLGFLPKRFAGFGEKAFRGICRSALEESSGEDGSILLSLKNICLVAGLGGKDHRDGSRAYYYSEPIVANEAKGTAPFILAYTEILLKEREEGNENSIS